MSSETQMPALPQQLPPPKFSRYRSVRQANGIKAASSPTLPFQTATALQDASVARSQSRYHKKVRSADTAAETVADQRARPPGHLHSHSASLAALTGELYPIPTGQDTQNNSFKTLSKDDALPSISTRIKSITRPARNTNPSLAVTSEKASQGPQSCFAPDPIISRDATSETEMNEEARKKLRAEEERLRRIKAKQNAAREFVRSKRIGPVDMTRPERLPHIGRDARKADMSTSQSIGPKPSIRRDGRIQGPALEEAKIVSPNQTRNAASNDTKTRESREGRRQDPATAEAPPPAVRNLSPRRKLAQPTQRRPPPPNQQLNTPIEAQPFTPSLLPLKPSEPDPVTSDIPRSAVNAGERRVVVKYNESVMSLPITPTTTTQDLLDCASTSMSSSFEPQQSALSESFTQLGLERPLRKYEHIRDVMNSWDFDAQNHLFVLTTSVNVLSKGDVDPRVLPKKPGGTSLYMYHSQRPGKWNKRWVSLGEDGQISISKRQDGSQSSNLCHLSDFDIYKPTQRQLKKLRSPKKVCFAIKSQQKSVMFLNGANFVHFFATSDGPLTETWYSAVRTWRSWYLVNVLGEGQDQAISKITSWESSAGAQTMALGTSGQNQPVSQRGQQSTLGMPKADSSSKATPRPPVLKALHNRDLCEVSLRGRSAPPSSFPNYQIHQPDPSVPASGPRRAPSLVRGGERTTSIRSSVKAPSSLRRSTSLSRAGSICQAAQPLVDLTPQFQEQPQHLRKGRGVAAVPGKPLVELATDVEALPGAITIPAARAWQRTRDTGLGVHVGDASTKKTSGGFAEPPSYDLAFTGTGLLSRSKSKRAQGGIGHGYGIKTGDRNHVGEPLVDLRLGSQFADGSLLRQVETLKGEDERGLVIDRAKTTEKDIKVGEGV
jgi:hypothetical protein